MSESDAVNVRIYPGVNVAPDAAIEDFVVIGRPAETTDETQLTEIGYGVRLRSHCVIYTGVRIGDHSCCGHHVVVREHTHIGDNVSIGTHSVIEHHVHIEDDVRIHSNVFVPELSRLEAGCWIGPNVVLTNAKYPRSPGVKTNLIGPIIESGAKIGANSTILPAVIVGRDALIGAGSVVTRDVPPRAVVAGNPGRIIGTIDELPYGAPDTDRPSGSESVALSLVSWETTS